MVSVDTLMCPVLPVGTALFLSCPPSPECPGGNKSSHVAEEFVEHFCFSNKMCVLENFPLVDFVIRSDCERDG